MKKTPEQAVADGAAWLEEVRPGSLGLIDLDSLDMLFNCVLDQVFDAEKGGHETGFGWALANFPTDLGTDKFIELGFGGYESVGDEWRRFITERRAQEPLAD